LKSTGRSTSLCWLLLKDITVGELKESYMKKPPSKIYDKIKTTHYIPPVDKTY